MRDAAASGIPSALADLGALVRIPSIAFPGFDPATVHRSAEAVAGLVRDTGLFDTVEIRTATIPETGEQGNPAVLATRNPAQFMDQLQVHLGALHDAIAEGYFHG